MSGEGWRKVNLEDAATILIAFTPLGHISKDTTGAAPCSCD